MKKRRVLFVGGAIAAVALIAVVVALSMRPSPAEPDPVTEPAPSDWASLPSAPAPEPPSTADAGEEQSDASELVRPFIAAESASRADRERSVDFSDIATGDAAEDLAVNAQEMFENGLVQIGSPELVSAVVTERDDDAVPPTVTVLVCLDYSAVGLEAPDGTSMKDEAAAQRVPSILVLNRVEERWLVSSRSFPDDPSC